MMDLSLQDQTSLPDTMGDSENGTEESGLPSPLPSIPRMLLGRSQSLFTGSAPNTLRATLREAVCADVSVISHREDNVTAKQD